MLRPGKIKIYWLLFAIYFVTVSLGLPLHKHYCMGDLKKIQLFIQPENCHVSDQKQEVSVCCNGKHDEAGEENGTCLSKDGNCCSDKLELYKIDVLSFYEKSNNSKINKLKILVLKSDTFYFSSKTNFRSELVKPKFITPLKLPDSKIKLAMYQQFIC